MNQRLQRLRARLAQDELDAILINRIENWRYLSGFTGDAGVLIITAERALLATDFRYYEQVKQQVTQPHPEWELVEVANAYPPVLVAKAAELGIKRLGFESHVLTVETFEEWKSALPDVTWVPTSGIVEDLCQVKDADELAVIEAAVHMADEAMAHIMAWIHPGVTERQVAWELEVYMRTHGAEGLSFPIIVGAGANGAMSHAIPSDRPINTGDPVVIDMGALYQGYCSDLTRSFCLGQASDAYRKIWDTVLQAQLAAEAAIKPGMSGIEVDNVARQIIYGAGYEGKFGHGLGHGVGLAIHEWPRFSMVSKSILDVGMVVTVEPGIYIPDWGGVRIEDMIVVTESGCRVLTQVGKTSVVGAR